jgi:hypothetical protein
MKAPRSLANIMLLAGALMLAPLQIEAQGACSPMLCVSPNPAPNGIATLSWDTGDGSHGMVYVSIDDGPEMLIGEGSSGAVTSNAIEAGKVYSIALYGPSGRRPALAMTGVARDQRINIYDYFPNWHIADDGAGFYYLDADPSVTQPPGTWHINTYGAPGPFGFFTVTAPASSGSPAEQDRYLVTPEEGMFSFRRWRENTAFNNAAMQNHGFPGTRPHPVPLRLAYSQLPALVKTTGATLPMSYQYEPNNGQQLLLPAGPPQVSELHFEYDWLSPRSGEPEFFFLRVSGYAQDQQWGKFFHEDFYLGQVPVCGEPGRSFPGLRRFTALGLRLPG